MRIMQKKCYLRMPLNITDQGLMKSKLCVKIANLLKGNLTKYFKVLIELISYGES